MKEAIELRDMACRNSLDAFTQKAFGILQPGTAYEWNWHVDCIAEHLEALHRGELRRLIINIPPRSLKSVLVAQIYPAWKLGHSPHHQFIGVSYAGKLAKRNVMQTRRLMQHEWYKALFPQAILATEGAEHFTTSTNGQYMGAGVMATITGFGADTLLIDDPLNPTEATSDQVRGNTNEAIRGTLFSRYNDERTAATAMIMQRVHDDDPTGNLFKDGGWHLLKLPAETKTKIIIDLGKQQWTMAENSLLFPARLSRDTLEQKRTDLGEYNYAGQYLQVPVPLGGGELRPEWVQYYGAGAIKPKEMNVVILVDAAGGEVTNRKKKKLSDWTAMAVIGLAPDNNYYLLDMIRDRLGPKERIDMLFVLHRKWNELCGKPPKVGYEKYGMMTDTHYIREKQNQDAYHFPVVELGGPMAKEDRIRRIIPDMQNGRWYFPGSLVYVDSENRRFDLVREILDAEMATFPRSRYDDMIDAISRVMDADLYMVFPRPKLGMTAKAITRYGSDTEPYGWETF